MSQKANSCSMKINIAVFEERGRWIAQALEHDVRVEGTNSAEAVSNIKVKLDALQILEKLCDLPPAPEICWEKAALVLSV